VGSKNRKEDNPQIYADFRFGGLFLICVNLC
jgi:hypothetical protein